MKMKVNQAQIEKNGVPSDPKRNVKLTHRNPKATAQPNLMSAKARKFNAVPKPAVRSHIEDMKKEQTSTRASGKTSECSKDKNFK